MIRAIIIAGLLVAGCAGTTTDANDKDLLTAAAKSWVGAPVDDMIRVWGKPNRQVIEPNEKRQGIVRWLARNLDGGLDYAGDMRCVVEARFGSDKIITAIDTVSYRCDQMFEDIANKLTRQTY